MLTNDLLLATYCTALHSVYVIRSIFALNILYLLTHAITTLLSDRTAARHWDADKLKCRVAGYVP